MCDCPILAILFTWFVLKGGMGGQLKTAPNWCPNSSQIDECGPLHLTCVISVSYVCIQI